MIGDIIFINVYFPCKGPDSLTVLQDIICEIDNLLSLFCNDKIVLSGDINNNMYESNKYTKLIWQFMAKYNIVLANDILKPNYEFSYANEALQSCSLVDYFMVTKCPNLRVVMNLALDDLPN